MRKNPSGSEVSEILQPISLAPTTILLASHDDDRVELQRIVLTISTCLNALLPCDWLRRYLRVFNMFLL